MIVIVDYGLGNIKAFANVYKRLDIPHCIARSPINFQGATKIVLPGVGAFDQAMSMLDASGMRETLDDLVIKKQIPVIGICVGMQILAKSSEEGELQGLGWIDAEVRRIDTSSLNHQTQLPHMGWNVVEAVQENPLLMDLELEPRFYFLHSYCFKCNNSDQIIAEAEYGTRFTCVVNSNNIYGVQFHPEKSHHNGVQLLKNFGNL